MSAYIPGTSSARAKEDTIVPVRPERVLATVLAKEGSEGSHEDTCQFLLSPRRVYAAQNWMLIRADRNYLPREKCCTRGDGSRSAGSDRSPTGTVVPQPQIHRYPGRALVHRAHREIQRDLSRGAKPGRGRSPGHRCP